MKEAKRLWSWLAIPCIALAVLTGSILPVLLVRGFYTVQIGPLGICEASGLTAGRRRRPTATSWTTVWAAGRILPPGCCPFRRRAPITLPTCGGCSCWWCGCSWRRRDCCWQGLSCAACGGQRLPRLGGRTPGFWAACGLGGLFLLIALLAALDFDRAFTVFHSIFFPGKDNWLFDPVTDPVILILPEAFFRNCAIAIVTVLLTVCIMLVVTGGKRPSRRSAPGEGAAS